MCEYFAKDLPRICALAQITLFAIGNHAPVHGFGIEREEAQLTWLSNDLSLSTADWKIVFGHHVLYSNGHYGSDRKLIARLQELFASRGVDLYIAGHEHDLQILEPVSGVSYMVSGAGSRTRSRHSSGGPCLQVHGDRQQLQLPQQAFPLQVEE